MTHWGNGNDGILVEKNRKQYRQAVKIFFLEHNSYNGFINIFTQSVEVTLREKRSCFILNNK